MSLNTRLDSNGVLYLWAKMMLHFVRQEPGKGLSANDLTNELKAMILGQFSGSWNDLSGKPTNVSAWVNDSNYQNAQEVAQLIAAALAASGFQTAAQVETAIDAALSELDTDVFVVVEELPAAGSAAANKIYLVPESDGDGMGQWIVVSGAWKRVGAVEASLEGYFNEENLLPISNEEIDEMIASLMQ